MINDGSKKITEYQKNIQKFKDSGGIDPTLPREKKVKDPDAKCYACGGKKGLTLLGHQKVSDPTSPILYFCDGGACRLRRAWRCVSKPTKGELSLYNSAHETKLTEDEYIEIQVNKKIAESQSKNAKYQDPNMPRRGRGRPKGNKIEKEPKDPNAPKRGRGRPKKEKSENDPIKIVDPNAPKRGRGRPRKEGSELVVKKEVVLNPDGTKRGRGRPPKIQQEFSGVPLEQKMVLEPEEKKESINE